MTSADIRASASLAVICRDPAGRDADQAACGPGAHPAKRSRCHTHILSALTLGKPDHDRAHYTTLSSPVDFSR